MVKSYGFGVMGLELIRVEKRYDDEGLRDLPTGRQVEVDILFLFCHPELVEGQNKKR